MTDITSNADWKDTPTVKACLAGGFSCAPPPKAPALTRTSVSIAPASAPTPPTFQSWQRTDAATLTADAQARGWIDKADRHRRLLDRLDALIAQTQEAG